MSAHSLEAVQQAHSFHQRRSHFDEQARLSAVVALLEWGVFSNRQVAEFTGATKRMVDALSTKTDATGGTLSPEALPHIVTLIRSQLRGEVDVALVARALDAGCSSVMLARLTGRPQSTLSRHARRAHELGLAA